VERNSVITKCYRCGAAGVTREHYPPRCLFPEGYRDRLTTVPSCQEHNNAHSLDVEYVKQFILMQEGINTVGKRHLMNNGVETFLHSPGLLRHVEREMKEVAFDPELLAIPLDLQRFETVMEAIAYAVHFNDFNRAYSGTWRIFSPNLASVSTHLEGHATDGWEEYRYQVLNAPYAPSITPHPRVFKYGLHLFEEDKLLYRFDFYEGFVVTALSAPASVRVTD